MQLTLDQQPVEVEANQLGQMLAAMQSHVQEQGRIIIEVIVDGESIVGDEIQKRQNQTVEGKSIALISAKPDELAIQTLTEVEARLAQTLEIQQQASQWLQENRELEALQHVSTIIETWLNVQQAVLQCCQLANIDFNELRADDFNSQELTERLLGQLQELKTLIETNDSSALADVLAFEWPDTVKHWRSLIEQLIHTVRQRQQG